MWVFLLFASTNSIGNSHTQENTLPTIGNGIAHSTLREEKRLGEAWLRLFRRAAPISTDPIVTEYTENLLAQLAEHDSDLKHALSLVIVKNTQLNAFAVPGGVVGVHTGLYHYAQTEGQFASVLTHELAHLSQRHYARNMTRKKGQQVLGMAALLAGILVAANSDSEAGMATIKASQGALIDRDLRFSRRFEEEADRIGLQTLVKAGYNPYDMVHMFEQMQRATRYYTTPPEFLLTHPLTAKRIADIENRARSLGASNTPSASTLVYDFIRARVLFLQEETPQTALLRFQNELKGFSPSTIGSRYGLVLSLIADNQLTHAKEALARLREQIPKNSPVLQYLIMAEADIAMGLKQNKDALHMIQQALGQWPDSYALHVHHSQLQMRSKISVLLPPS